MYRRLHAHCCLYVHLMFCVSCLTACDSFWHGEWSNVIALLPYSLHMVRWPVLMFVSQFF